MNQRTLPIKFTLKPISNVVIILVILGQSVNFPTKALLMTVPPLSLIKSASAKVNHPAYALGHIIRVHVPKVQLRLPVHYLLLVYVALFVPGIQASILRFRYNCVNAHGAEIVPFLQNQFIIGARRFLEQLCKFFADPKLSLCPFAIILGIDQSV